MKSKMRKIGVDSCKCPNCNNTMKFNDIVYGRYGSMREHLRKKVIEENEDKLEKIIELYAITKGIIYGRINPKRRGKIERRRCTVYLFIM